MSDRLTTSQSMANDAALVSGDGRYAAYLQSDANLVLCYTTNGAADLSPAILVLRCQRCRQLR